MGAQDLEEINRFAKRGFIKVILISLIVSLVEAGIVAVVESFSANPWVTMLFVGIANFFILLVAGILFLAFWAEFVLGLSKLEKKSNNPTKEEPMAEVRLGP
jgi:hypothetical protein